MKRLLAGTAVVAALLLWLGSHEADAIPDCSGDAGVEAHYDGNPATCTAVGGVYQWVPVSRRLQGVGTINFPSILLNGCSTQTMTPAAFANVTTAYYVACFPMTDLTGGAFLAQSWMSGAGQVSIKVCSIGVVTDPPSMTFGCVVAL